MTAADYVVGGVAAVLGAVLVLAAVFNWEWSFRLAKVEFIEARWGRNAARLVYALVGCALLGLAAALLSGSVSRPAAAADSRLGPEVGMNKPVAGPNGC
jgi:hypothetical protein